MLTAICAAAAAFHMPVSQVGMSRVAMSPMMDGSKMIKRDSQANSIQKQSDNFGQKFWEKPDFVNAQAAAGKAKAAEANESYIYGTKDPDTQNKAAFWKQPEWIAKQEAASKANAGKWMAGSGQANWGETGGVPVDGIYYKYKEGSSGWKSK